MSPVAQPNLVSRWRVVADRPVTVAAVIAAVACAVLVLLPSHGRGHQAGVPGPRVGRGTSGAGPDLGAPGNGRLRLVLGSRMVNGVYTDYPHSQAGAVSAAVEFLTELGSTLDPDRAATVARLTAGPSYPAAAQDAAASAVAARRRLGLPASGPLPPGTAVFCVPVMYQLRGASADQLTVLLLFNYTKTAPSGTAEHIGVASVRVGWTLASWRLLRPAGADLSGLLTTPGTAQAAAKGWKVMIDAM